MTVQISRESFSSLPRDEQAKVLYDILCDISNKLDSFVDCHKQHMAACESRFKKLENRKLIDKTFAGAMGFIGGFIESFIRWK